MAEPSRANINVVELVSVTDSKIGHVSLYTGLAEVTRVCASKLTEGSNKIVISGLPNVLVEESLRVEGRGPCVIHEVSISEIPVKAPKVTSLKLEGLLKQKTRVEKAVARCKKSIATVNLFQNSLEVKNISASDLGGMEKGVESVSEELDNKFLDLEENLEELEKEIQEERKALGEAKGDDKLRKRVSITVFAEKECEVEIVLIYGVKDATWDAAYDIYAKMDTKEKPVTLLYKSMIVQGTGEAWEDVPLTLETATPTFGVSIPELRPWTLSVYTPWHHNLKSMMKSKKKASFGFSLGGGGSERRESRQRYQGAYYDDAGNVMASRGLLVSSKGDINATFSVPGLITVPSDGASHTVTISELDLDATMSWVSIPKKTPKAHLTAKIKNDSEYTFLRGIGSIYVDGSFISRSEVPAVSPQESFDCPLGIDPTIRVVYHPRSKKVNHSGFTRKTCSYVFDQRITITNTKSSTIESLKILEQFPVSEDATIVVNLLNPGLIIPQPNKKGEYAKAEPVKVTAQVTAQWNGAEDSETDPTLLGKDGKFSWDCSIPSQGKLNLTLSWEVVCPYGTDIMGLDM
ncbi:hypothetical protein BDZ97DRAFT_2078234 [Flammula alnicola]|nr:hypothetical protein BDZ97DRAFT_2078234 [Flammula alnicola]